MPRYIGEELWEGQTVTECLYISSTDCTFVFYYTFFTELQSVCVCSYLDALSGYSQASLGSHFVILSVLFQTELN